MKIRRLASSHGVGPSLWKSQMAALGRNPTKGFAVIRPRPLTLRGGGAPRQTVASGPTARPLSGILPQILHAAWSESSGFTLKKSARAHDAARCVSLHRGRSACVGLGCLPAVIANRPGRSRCWGLGKRFSVV